MKASLDTVWSKYQTAKLYAALQGDFNFDQDYKAYEAYVTGDVASLQALTRMRLKPYGFTANQKLKFKKEGKGSRADAIKRYEKAQRARKVKFDYPSKLTKVTKTEAIYR